MLTCTELTMFEALMAPWRFEQFMHDIEFMDGLPVIDVEVVEEPVED